MAANAIGSAVVIAPAYALTIVAGDVGTGLGRAVPHGGRIKGGFAGIAGTGDLVTEIPLPDTAVRCTGEACRTHLSFGDNRSRLKGNIDVTVDVS